MPVKSLNPDPATTQRLQRILGVLRRAGSSIPRTRLCHTDPWELLVATMLSAQCTDTRVNQITPALFTRYPSVESFVQATPRDIEPLIRSAGLYRTKARNIIACANMICTRFGGRVPATMAELVQLPGVARKTANIVLVAGFGKADGIAVDTHVQRLAGRLGLSAQRSAVAIERDLMALLPRRDWHDINFLLVDHGRAICTARAPKCVSCPIRSCCPSAAGNEPQAVRQAP